MRERVLVMLAVFAVVYQVADFIVFERQAQRIAALNQAMASDQEQIRRLNAEQIQLAGQPVNDPARTIRNDIDRTRERVGVLRVRLNEALADMISPRDMAVFLEQLLTQEARLKLNRLQTFQPVALQGKNESAEALASGVAVAHRHIFEVEFDGDYLTTLRYLEALERLPWRFTWESIDFEVVDYPHSQVRLRLHTLSLSEDWIGV
jgi:MSHA biogenesis protein MshJ